MSDFKDMYDQWRENKYKPTKDSFGERKEEFTTDSGIQVNPLYTPEETRDIDYLDDINFPGQFPFTRGVYPTMYRSKMWTMRQYAGFGTAQETNERFRYLLDQGQTGLSTAFDLPTQIGYDSTHDLARGEVGRVGVAIDTLADMEVLFDQIPLDKVSTSMTINAPAAVLLAMYIAVGEKQGVDKSELTGTTQNDILKEYIARGTYIFPPGPSLRLITDLFEYCSREMPKWNTISISGYHIREAGSDAVQEVAFTLANGIEYVNAAMDAGLEVDEFAPRLSFFFNAQMNFLEEIAKFRAARRLWAEIMKDRFGAQKEKSCMLRFHTQTAGAALTAQQPQNNIIRVAIQALAGVLGGTQSLHTNSYDEALSLPTEESVRIALRTQQIIAEETGVADTVDPLGGSYAIEAMTDRIVQEARDYIDEIDKLGGMVEAINTGYVQKEIQDTAYDMQKEIEEGDRVVVGVNKYQEEGEEQVEEILTVDEELEENQRQRLSRVKEERDQTAVDQHLKAIEAAAEKEENLMYPLVEAVKDYVSLGEICAVLREEFGEYEAKHF